ncbi:MAG: AgmX/PglI C-terminal domain-containing protein [Bdellovibrionaceae bacterium]|nr:AgmX/PglI C-terminal domain-containing protein [Pseudobdellovibrionaceae bacterium]
MGRPEIYIEHSHGEKVRKHLRVKPGKGDLFLIGSSKEADLRLAGEEITGCHAVLRFRSPHWYLCDISGTKSTRVGAEPIVERRIDGRLDVELGRHRLTLFAKERNDSLFHSEMPEGDKGLHQVVVRAKGRVIDTKVLGATEPFRFRMGLERTELAAPTSGEWVITEIGGRTIQQRLVPTQAIVAAEKISVDRDLKRPFLTAGVITLLLMLTVILWPKAEPTKAEDASLAKQQMEMIFNAKTIKKKKMEVAKMSSSRVKAGGNNESAATKNRSAAAPEESMAPKTSAKVTQALTSLRQSGLSALVGKIAKRANKSGVLVAASGVSPDTQGAGRAFYSMGKSTTGGGGSASKEGNTFRLGGVGTQGKGGGAGDFKAGTALAGGSVGMGDVAVVDEETMIEGGLDRDVIAEFIKRNLGQIRYCYERQLSSDKNLYGKVMVRFTIGATGAVGDPKIDNSTMRNAMVEGCILRRVASWKFPEPKGGTMVKVSYPFLFKALD